MVGVRDRLDIHRFIKTSWSCCLIWCLTESRDGEGSKALRLPHSSSPPLSSSVYTLRTTSNLSICKPASCLAMAEKKPAKYAGNPRHRRLTPIRNPRLTQPAQPAPKQTPAASPWPPSSTMSPTTCRRAPRSSRPCARSRR